jgi:DNA-directed RNA polymerase specialized sigma24 family protein
LLLCPSPTIHQDDWKRAIFPPGPFALLDERTLLDVESPPLRPRNVRLAESLWRGGVDMSPDLRPTREQLLEEAEPIIQSIVRKKLFVTLHKSDFREQNLDAFDVLGEIRLKLLQKLSGGEADPGEEAIGDFRGYAAAVAYHTCADHLRARYPERTNLKNCLRRMLQKADGYAAWSAPNGELLCGYVGWQNQPFKLDKARIATLEGNPGALPPSALPKRATTHLTLEEWLALLDGVFQHVGPLPLDDLVSIVSSVLGVSEMVNASHLENDEGDVAVVDTIPSADPDAHSKWLHQERLRLFWGAIQQLLPWHRSAYLLNLRADDLDALPYYGIASVQQIGDSLELRADQLDTIWDELLLESTTRRAAAESRDPFERFAILWRYMPLEDTVIAKLLGVTRPQVIGYRNKAKERLARNLKCLL